MDVLEFFNGFKNGHLGVNRNPAETEAYCSCLGVGVLDGLLYAVGGHDGPLVRKSVECYNPETTQWVQIADMHLCRRNAGRSMNQSCKEMR